jgi:Rieske Fe-S protein
MTAESPYGEAHQDERRRDPRPTRRGVLLGAGLAGLGGVLAGCSTKAVPYGANEAGVAPDDASAPGMAGSSPGPSSGAASGPASPGRAPAATTPGNMASPGHSPGRGSQAEQAKQAKGARGARGAKGKASGTVLGAASEIPVGGGKIFAAQKVVVTQPARGRYVAFSAVCTHVGCIMSEVADGTIDCPCHGGQFKISNGAVVTGPPPRPLPRKQVKLVSGQIVLV